MEPALDRPAQAAQGGGGKHSFRRSAHPEQHVHAGGVDRGRDCGGDVAVRDQVDAGAGAPDAPDQLIVARPIEHNHGQVLEVVALRGGDALQILFDRPVEVDRGGGPRADRDLLHVRVRGVEEMAALGEGDHREGVRPAVRDRVGAFQGIERNVDLGTFSRADRLADVEHRRFVPLPLADDDRALNVHDVEDPPHRRDGGLIGGVLVSASHPAGGRERGRLGDTHQLEAEVSIHLGQVSGSELRRRRSRRFLPSR